MISNNKEQAKRRNELIEKALTQKNGGRYLMELQQDISCAVASAINPINDISAPFIIAVLRTYIKSLSETVPKSSLIMADKLMEDGSWISMKIPTGSFKVRGVEDE